jgi:outer membrane receptor protein involved in Fe transport
MLFLYLILTLVSPFIYSQNNNNFTIKGELKSKENNESVIGASIYLLNPKDSSIVTGAYSKLVDDKSIFEIKSKAGDFILKITHVTTQEKYLKVKVENDLDLKTIYLNASDFILEDVIVNADKEYMELQLDKRVYNVSQDATNKGRNVSDILDNLPSVSIDAEGQVSLRGSENVRILVDGRVSGLVSRDPENLRMMMGEMVDRVEIITNPSAKYDAEGQVGIINIVLKKEQRKGFNGSSELTTGTPDNYGLTLISNYRDESYNFFTSLGYNYRKYPGFADMQQYFYNDTNKFLTTTRRDQLRGGNRLTLRVGSDFFLNDNNTLTLSGNYSFGVRDNSVDLVYKDFTQSNDLITATSRIDNEDEDSESFEVNLAYNLDFEKKGHNLKITTNFEQDQDLEESMINQKILNISDNNILQRSSNLEFERNQLYQLDYVYPFSKEGKFEAGMKSTLRKIDNDFWFKQQNSEGEFEIIDDFNNNFIYFEDIYAAYLIAGDKLSDFSWQFGLRSEYSDITTELKKTDYSNPRTYFNFFPSAHFSYKVSQLNSIQLSYARRIQRPSFRSLMPISSFSDNRNFWIGNPDLDPEFADSYETGHLFTWEKGSILSSVYYRHSTNIIQRITYLNEDGVTNITPFNIGTRDDLGFEFNFTYAPYKWLNFNTNINTFNVSIDGNSSVSNLNSESWATNLKLNTKIKMFWGIDFSFNYNYRGPMDIPQGKMKDVWFIDFALSKDLLENLTVTATGSDIFSTRMRRMITRDVDYYYNQDFQWRGGLFSLSISYRLNQDKKQAKRSMDSMNDEE